MKTDISEVKTIGSGIMRTEGIEEALRERMRDRGEDEDKITKSIQRLHQYSSMDTDKVDTTNLSESETVDKILSVIL